MRTVAPTLLAAAVSACTYPLPQGMKVTQSYYLEPMALYEACGQFGACVETDHKTYCNMHLPLAMSGDPLGYEHELSHCGGRLDAPKRDQ
jgi:hypothetical protein